MVLYNALCEKLVMRRSRVRFPVLAGDFSLAKIYKESEIIIIEN